MIHISPADISLCPNVSSLLSSSPHSFFLRLTLLKEGINNNNTDQGIQDISMYIRFGIMFNAACCFLYWRDTHYDTMLCSVNKAIAMHVDAWNRTLYMYRFIDYGSYVPIANQLDYLNAWYINCFIYTTALHELRCIILIIISQHVKRPCIAYTPTTTLASDMLIKKHLFHYKMIESS